MTYAVIRTGGKQYRVSAGDVVKVEKLPGDVGEQITIGDVLFIGGDGDVKIGAPLASFNPATLYGGGSAGYTDYPAIAGAAR